MELQLNKLADKAKQHGIHYTPAPLAIFLANQILPSLPSKKNLTILDPACGDGSLLVSMYMSLSKPQQKNARLIGFERDAVECKRADENLSAMGVANIDLRCEDFLNQDGIAEESSTPLFRGQFPMADVVISNPPYVRTQVLGARKSRELARRFGLTGRVDLYHAFTIAMSECLAENGVLGLLTSNRFLTIRSGEKMRKFLRNRINMKSVIDLGDTKLFGAAVLPAIVVGTNEKTTTKASCIFDRIYEYRGKAKTSTRNHGSLLDTIQNRSSNGIIRTPEGTFKLERGELQDAQDGGPWVLLNKASKRWLNRLEQNSMGFFGDVVNVKVGVKTTADKVFIREWDALPADTRPESSLLYPLITHHAKANLVCNEKKVYTRKILYPYKSEKGKRQLLDISLYPQARKYLNQNKEQLGSRKYLIEAGRKWYEIWVPQNPADWGKPKIVFPDISEFPRFWLDLTGSIVNGDCYWMSIKEGEESDWVYIVLAVANSTLIEKHYDTMFHNKLYAGRRRFMTQYVKKFPLPQIEHAASQSIISTMKKVIAGKLEVTDSVRSKLNQLVWQAFNLTVEKS